MIKRCLSCSGELKKLNDDELECLTCGRVFDVEDEDDQNEKI